jgi:hypothetical protein
MKKLLYLLLFFAFNVNAQIRVKFKNKNLNFKEYSTSEYNVKTSKKNYKIKVKHFKDSNIVMSISGRDTVCEINDTTDKEEYVYYRKQFRKKLKKAKVNEAPALCGASTTPSNATSTLVTPTLYTNTVINKRLDVYIEVAYNLYVQLNNVNTVTTRVANLFENSRLIYLNEGVIINNNELFINTTVPVGNTYQTMTSIGAATLDFGTRKANHSGRVALLLTGFNYGGYAYIKRGELQPKSGAFGTCGLGSLSTNYSNSTYNWGVYVFTHELGHICGVSHTQNDCAWIDENGNRLGRLDSCAACESSCTPKLANCNGSTKRMTGTIMSYCHIYGQVLMEFGKYPRAVLRNAIMNSNLPTVQIAPCTTIYTVTSTCTNGQWQTRSFSQTGGNCITPPTDSLNRVCPITEVVTNQVCYIANNKWRVRFNFSLPTGTYALNVCRYGNNCSTANLITPTCGSRGSVTANSTELVTGIIDRELSPQPSPPSAGTWCYRTSITINGKVYWTPYFTIIR